MIEVILVISLGGIFFILLKRLPDVEFTEEKSGINSNSKNFIKKPFINKDPSKSFYLLEKADQAFGEKKYALAEKRYLKAATMAPQNGKICGRLGIIYLEKGNHLDAKDAFLEAIKRENSNPLWHNNLGLALYNLKRFSESIEAYKKSIELDNSENIRYYNCGLSYEALDEFEKALQSYDKALSMDPENPDYQKSVEKMKNKLNI